MSAPPRPRARTTSPPRSALVAGVATLVTTLAHSAAHGTSHLPPGRTAAAAGIAFVLLLAAQEVVGSRRPGALELAAWLLGGQGVVHSCLLLAADPTTADVTAAAHGSASAMLAAHLAAAVVHAAGVCGVRHCLLVAALAVVAGAGRLRHALRITPAPGTGHLHRWPAGRVATPAARLHCVLLVPGCLDRRGPPAARAPPPTVRIPKPRSTPCP